MPVSCYGSRCWVLCPPWLVAGSVVRWFRRVSSRLGLGVLEGPVWLFVPGLVSGWLRPFYIHQKR